MSKYLLLLFLCYILQTHAFVPTETDDDIEDNEIDSDIKKEDNRPIVTAYSNLIQTLKYPKDVKLNNYMNFKNNDQESLSKNANVTKDDLESIQTTESIVTPFTTQSAQNDTEQNEINYDKMSWRERLESVCDNLKKFLKTHDLELKLPFNAFHEKVVILSLNKWLRNGTAIELTLHPEERIDDQNKKLPKEELQSLQKFKSSVRDLYRMVYKYAFLTIFSFGGIALRMLIFPGSMALILLPFIFIIRFLRRLFERRKPSGF